MHYCGSVECEIVATLPLPPGVCLLYCVSGVVASSHMGVLKYVIALWLHALQFVQPLQHCHCSSSKVCNWHGFVVNG